MNRTLTTVLAVTLFILQSCCAQRAMATPKMPTHCPINARQCPATKRTCAPTPLQVSTVPAPPALSATPSVAVLQAPPALCTVAAGGITHTEPPFTHRNLQLRI